MKKHGIVRTVSGTLLITAAATVAVITMSTANSRDLARAQDANQSGAPADTPIPVEVTTPQRRTVTRPLTMPATLLAGEMADLHAKTSGYITEVAVDIGDRVKKNDALLIIDVPEMIDELRSAEAVLEAKLARVVQAESLADTARAQVKRHDAEFELAKLTLSRTTELRQAAAIPQQEMDNARGRLQVAEAMINIAHAAVASAEADIRSAQAQAAVARAAAARLRTLMEYTTLRAPFDGVITERNVDPGAFVRSAAEGASAPLLSIAMTDFIRLALEIPESDVPFVRPGTEVEIDVKALRGDPIHATITRIAVAVKPGTRTMRAEVRLNNDDGRLAPGMYARVVVKLETKEQAMVIPSPAVRVRGRDLSVLVAAGSVARTVPIQLGYDDGIWAEITGGLTGDEQIILPGNSAVAPGAAVAVVRAGI
ncbi:MAG: efflux RND transporter periplasmic adaptor subunit [Phycisphaerae bacterium]